MLRSQSIPRVDYLTGYRRAEAATYEHLSYLRFKRFSKRSLDPLGKLKHSDISCKGLTGGLYSEDLNFIAVDQ